MRSATIVLLTLALGALASLAADQQPKAILALHTYGYDAPGRGPLDLNLARTIRESSGGTVDLYVETLDPNRFGSEAQLRRTREYLREKYADKNVAVVAALYDQALAFLLDDTDPVFPDLPIAAVVVRQPKATERVSAIWSGNMIGQTVAMALKLHPQARQVAVIDGTPNGGGGAEVFEEERRQIEAVAPRIPIIPLRNLPLGDLLARVEALPPDTVIFMIRQFIGRRGEPISVIDAMSELTRVARSPIYIGSGAQTGLGAIGGKVISIELEARQLGELALKLAADPSYRVPLTESTLVPIFDWRQLRRWGVDEATLPAGSVVQFRQSSVWDEYRLYILGAAAIVAVQTALIAGFAMQRVRRRRTEGALRESEQHLRQSYEENQDLAGRLIDAQEQERTRIARDLHDDLSQQLAGLGIVLSGLRRKVGKPELQHEVDHTFTTLQDRTSALAEAIRNLSHQLHPSVLQHAGLVATLRRHCAEVEAHHNLSVTFRAVGDLDALGPDVSLCLFRVTQEALTNAVRHARAHTIDVQLAATSEGVELRISDDGVGFVASERGRSGLGLRSIDERVRLTHGIVSVDSSPGQGTHLRVRIPAVAAAAAEVSRTF